MRGDGDAKLNVRCYDCGEFDLYAQREFYKRIAPRCSACGGLFELIEKESQPTTDGRSFILGRGNKHNQDNYRQEKSRRRRSRR